MDRFAFWTRHSACDPVNPSEAAARSIPLSAKELLRIAAPIIVMNLAHSMMSFVDMAFVSRLGRAETAALLPAGVWLFSFTSFPMGLLGAGIAFVSQSLGKGEREDCAAYAWQGVWFAAAAGAVMFGLLPFAPALFGLFGHSPEVIADEVLYFRIMIFGSIPMLLYFAFNNFFIGVGDTVTPMWAGIAGNVFNIVADWVLIFGFGPVPAYGIAGAAWASVAGSVLCAAMMGAAFFSRKNREGFGTHSQRGLRPEKIARLLRVGLPKGIRMTLEISSFAVFTAYMGRFGESQLAANNIAVRILHLAFLPAYGFGSAASTMVGRSVGKKRFGDARAAAWMALRYGMLWNLFVGLTFIYFPGAYCSLFGGDAETLEWTRRIMFYMAFFQLFDAASIMLSGALEGAGDTQWTMWTHVAFMWFVFLPVALLMSVHFRMEVIGGWVGGISYVVGLTALFAWRFHRGPWEKIDIFK